MAKTFLEIKEYLKNYEYELLSVEYINALTKLDIKCPEGHIFQMPYATFQQGHRCSICFGTPKKTLNEVKQYIESFDYKLLSTEYKNNREKLELQCSEGHKFETSYNNFLHSKARCPKCYTHNKLLYSNIKNYIESQNYKLLSKIYYNSNLKLKLQCPEGHIYDVKYHSFKNGRRCPVCSENKGWSKPEKEIFEYIKSIYSGEILENDRTQVKNYWSGYNLELDIFLPELSKAIEYNGIYWHNKNNDVKWKDEIKKKQCIKKDIDLLVITENHWLSNKLNCLNKINDFILV